MTRNYKRNKTRKCPKLEDTGLQIKRALLRAEGKSIVTKMGHRQRVRSSMALASHRNPVTHKKIKTSSQNIRELFSIQDFFFPDMQSFQNLFCCLHFLKNVLHSIKEENKLELVGYQYQGTQHRREAKRIHTMKTK